MSPGLAGVRKIIIGEPASILTLVCVALMKIDPS